MVQYQSSDSGGEVGGFFPLIRLSIDALLRAWESPLSALIAMWPIGNPHRICSSIVRGVRLMDCSGPLAWLEVI